MKHHTKFSLFCLLLCSSFISNAQSTQTGLGFAGHSPLFGGVPLRYVGWDASVASNAIPLSIEHRGTNNINFLTGGLNRMTILGTASGATAGFVGIGTIAPAQRLEINAGNINILTNTNAYMLGSQNILWHKGNTRNIFVGVGAGNNHAGPASNNSYVGSNAGFSGNGSLINQQNTIFGADAGFSNEASNHVFVGYKAANAQSSMTSVGLTVIGAFAGEIGTGNGETVFVGYRAGQSTNSSSNTFVGFLSGENNTGGGANSFFGYNSGNNNGNYTDNTYLGGGSGANSNGNGNTCVGRASGASGVGNSNVLLGYRTMVAATGGNQNVIIGYEANSTTTSNDFNTMVGTEAGKVNTTGANNTFIGYRTALNQTTGNSNAYLGTNTGNNIASGNNNTFIGGSADATNANSNLTNASAIGANAQVTNDDHMILGDNNVNIGIGLSADPTGPQNKLEINTAAASPIPGASGLRFRDLTNTSTPQPNLGMGVLSVDINGDVIYVSTSAIGGANNGLIVNASNTQLGGDCSIPSQVAASALLSNREIPMGGFNFMYSGASGNFGIGHATASCNTTFGRFEVINTTRRAAIAGSTSFSNAGGVFGVLGQGSNTGTGNAIGVRGQAGTCPDPASFAIGVRGESEVTTNRNNYGGFFVANNGISSNIAVYGTAPAGPLTPTTITQPPVNGNYAGYFNGNVVRTGSDNFTSDQNLKQNIDTIPNAMVIISQLKPKSFDYKQSSYPSMSLPAGKQYGLIAQDVLTVLPELVNNNMHPAQLDSAGNVVTPSFDYLSLEYQQLIGIMLKGMQEQQAQIKKQDSLITVLSNKISSCCSNNSSRQSNTNQLDVELSDKDAIVLNQNVPNPFAEQTTITYNVPVSVGKAQIIFFNNLGQIIQTVDIKTRGKGKVNVFASDLSSGLYNYTLVADGKVIDSKKMVRE